MCSCTTFQESRDSPTVFIPQIEDTIGVSQVVMGRLGQMAEGRTKTDGNSCSHDRTSSWH